MKRVQKMNDKTVIGDDVDDSSWDPADVQVGEGPLPPGAIAAYRATVEVTDDVADWDVSSFPTVGDKLP